MDRLLLLGLHLKVEVTLTQQEWVEGCQVDHDLIPKTQRPALMQEEAVGIEGLHREGDVRGTGSRALWFWSSPFPFPHGTSNSQGISKATRDAQNQVLKSPLLTGYVGPLAPTLGIGLEDAC